MSFVSISPIGFNSIYYPPNQPMDATEQGKVSTIQQLLCTDFSPLRNALALQIPSHSIILALNLFRQIQDRPAKIDAFASLLFSKGCPEAKQFYDALPVDVQNEFKHQLWIANNCLDNGMGLNFGDHFVASFELCGNGLAMQAVQAMRFNRS